MTTSHFLGGGVCALGKKKRDTWRAGVGGQDHGVARGVCGVGGPSPVRGL